jgi:GH25 family lysozyme M1 (1,4-beta-N-acetylmuramidase)
MKFSSILAVASASLPLISATVEGFDVSHWQSSVDFAGAYKAGLRFVMIKATESTNYQDPKVSFQLADPCHIA